MREKREKARGGTGRPARSPPARPDRLDRRVLAGGLAASLALHALLFLLVRSGLGLPVRAESAPSAAAPAPGATADALRGVRLPPLRSEIRRPARPRVTVPEPEIALRPPGRPRVETALAAAVAEPPTLGVRDGRGAERGGGPSGATGGGGGGPPGTAPPVPTTLFPEWDPPDAVRGTEVTVRVRVDAGGRPTGEVELVPPTADRGFNRRLVEKALRMEYRPARRDGVPVPGWAEITFVF